MSGITMRDIGRQLGVSAVTVSKALAGKSGVSEEMRQKIIRRASELGYVNPNAPQTTPTSGLDVGILIPENFFSVVSFYATFYKQLVQALTDAGHFGIMELVTHDMQTALTLPNLLRSRHVDALICLGQLTSPYMQLLTRQEMPVICLDFHDPFVTTDAIVSDNAFGAAQLTYWLIEQGHRDIGFVGDIKATSSIMERYLRFFRPRPGREHVPHLPAAGENADCVRRELRYVRAGADYRPAKPRLPRAGGHFRRGLR